MASGPLAGAALSGGLLAVALQGFLGWLPPVIPLSPLLPEAPADPAAALPETDAARESPSPWPGCSCSCEDSATGAGSGGEEHEPNVGTMREEEQAGLHELQPAALAPGTRTLMGPTRPPSSFVLATFVTLDALLLMAFLARRLWGQAASALERRLKYRLIRLELGASGEFPEAQGVAIAASCVSSAACLGFELAAGMETLARAVGHMGTELQDGLQRTSPRKSPDKSPQAAAQLLGAWHEVGDASLSCSRQLREVGAALQAATLEADGARLQVLAAARALQRAYSKAERASCSWQAWLSGRSKAPPVVGSSRHARFECRRAEIARGWAELHKEAEALQQRSGAALADADVKVRQLAQALGDRLVNLQPGWRAGTAQDALPDSQRASSSGQRVGKLIRSWSTAAGRQQLRDAEEAEVAKITAQGTDKPAPGPVLSPDAKSLGMGEWRINNDFEHSVLKIGLRVLDQRWPTDELFNFPQGRGGASRLFREKQIRELLEGGLALQSMLGGDVAAAQRDMYELSSRQLLRLRTRHLDFVPSGCGSNTASGIGDSHEALLSLVDRLLFQHLGREAVGDQAPGGSLTEPGAHRLGREAVLIAAAAAAIPAPPSWVWWLTERCRVFFNPVDFASFAVFPADGVLEVTDQSKPDEHDPTGHRRFLDWHISVVTAESHLSGAPPCKAGAAGGGLDGEDTRRAKDSEVSASGSAAEVLVLFPQKLQAHRSSLHRTVSS